jgi:RNA polymerase sigma-70 factor (ECF subfamily)
VSEDDIKELLRRAGGGEQDALGALLDRYRDHLRRMVRLRLDRRLQARVDVSDIVQEAWLEVARRSEGYLAEPKLPFLLWLRLITAEKIVSIERKHLGAQARDARREVQLGGGAVPAAETTTLAGELIGPGTSPTRAAARGEIRAALESALNRMDPIDREVLVLRHFEHLDNVEAAHELGIQPEAARKRYFRAAVRLRELLREIPSFDGGIV